MMFRDTENGKKKIKKVLIKKNNQRKNRSVENIENMIKKVKL